MADFEESKSNEEEETGTIMDNEQIIALVKEKIEEKNEVIKEQQIQIQELQDKVGGLEEEIASQKAAAGEREELVKKISEILE